MPNRWWFALCVSPLLVVGVAGFLAHRKAAAIALGGSVSLTPCPDCGVATAQRPNYRNSVIPGGIENPDELRAAIAKDPVVAEHYKDIQENVDGSLPAISGRARSDRYYASFRKGNGVYWTTKPLALRDGELLLLVMAGRDGRPIFIRGRCGNQLSNTPRKPTLPAGEEPTSTELDELEPVAVASLRFILTDQTPQIAMLARTTWQPPYVPVNLPDVYRIGPIFVGHDVPPWFLSEPRIAAPSTLPVDNPITPAKPIAPLGPTLTLPPDEWAYEAPAGYVAPVTYTSLDPLFPFLIPQGPALDTPSYTPPANIIEPPCCDAPGKPWVPPGETPPIVNPVPEPRAALLFVAGLLFVMAGRMARWSGAR